MRSINELHWETLEAELTSNEEGQVTVIRVVPTKTFPKDRFAHLKTPGPFRILLIVARSDLSETNHRVATNSLIRCAECLGSDVLQVDVVRPGTFAAFKKHLARAAKRGLYYNLIHFDMHGSVKERGTGSNAR